ncbi:late competence development ComFB family protein [Metabacillus sp. RGM 3146]|uniref:late competence development ComFB family protein n=1 Tax=Metabacillus sp. RGM 3146 TaxID=3401092 RepID=UPI003B9A8669
MEQIMEDLLKRYLDRFQMECICRKCQDDVLALSLNRVKPKYVTKESGVSYVKAAYFDQLEITSLVIILAECAKMVSENPRCENRIKQ